MNDRHTAEPVCKRLEQLLGEVRKAERRAEGRIYTPRFRPGKEAQRNE